MDETYRMTDSNSCVKRWIIETINQVRQQPDTEESSCSQTTEMIEDKVTETTGRGLVDLSSITEIIDEESITELIEENSEVMNLINPMSKFRESKKWWEKKRIVKTKKE